MTSQTKIEQYLRDSTGHNYKKALNFLGIYLYDEINELGPRELQGKCIIINYITSKETQHLGHYVVLDFRKELKANNYSGPYFIDPYGFVYDYPREILGLPNTHNIAKLLSRMHNSSILYNTTEWQVLQPYDNLCGWYCFQYVLQPSYNINPIFGKHLDRSKMDHILEAKLEASGFIQV